MDTDLGAVVERDREVLAVRRDRGDRAPGEIALEALRRRALNRLADERREPGGVASDAVAFGHATYGVSCAR